MESQILFLGSGGDSYVIGRQIRGSGGIVIHVEGYQFHIDPGPGALVRAAHLGINPRETTAIITTDGHLNHSNDVNTLIAAMTHNGLDRKGVLITNSTFANGSDNIKPGLNDFYKKCVERIIVIKEGQRVGIENIEIEALPTKHSDPNAIGLRFMTPQFNLVYTGDTRYSNEVIKKYSGCDILIMNVTHPFNEKSKDHLNSEDAVKIIEKVKPRLAILTHFGAKMLAADPLYETRDIQKKTGVQVIAAKDGLSINPVSYSAQLRQKTLNLY